jgi:O-antigen/teichoic acid export membrane protein
MILRSDGTDEAGASVELGTIAVRGSGVGRLLLGTVVTDLVIVACGLVTGPLTARLLQPDGRGAVAAAQFWPQVLMKVGLISADDAAGYRSCREPDRIERITRSFLALGLGLAAILVPVGYLALPLLLGADRAHVIALSRTYLAIVIPAQFVTLGVLAVDQAELRLGVYNLKRLLVPFTYLAVLIFLWARALVSVESVLWASCSGIVVIAMVSLFTRRRALFGVPSRAEIRELLTIGASFHVGSLILFLTAHLDRLIVLNLWPDAVVGQYVVAVTMGSSLASAVSGGFQRVFFPRVARSENPYQRAVLLARGIRCAGVVLLIMSVPMALTAAWCTPLLFGEAFRDAAVPAAVMAIVHCLIGLRALVLQGLRGLGQPLPGAIAGGLTLVILLACAWPLAATLGMVGVALSVGIANCAALAYLTWHLCSRCNFRFTDIWRFDNATFVEVGDLVGDMLPIRLTGSSRA